MAPVNFSVNKHNFKNVQWSVRKEIKNQNLNSIQSWKKETKLIQSESEQKKNIIPVWSFF